MKNNLNEKFQQRLDAWRKAAASTVKVPVKPKVAGRPIRGDWGDEYEPSTSLQPPTKSKP